MGKHKKPTPKSKEIREWIVVISMLITSISTIIVPILNFILKLLGIS